MIPKNILSETSHLLVINRQGMKDLELQIQTFDMPSMTINSILAPSVKREGLNMPGTRVDFDPLNVTVLLDEDLESWYSVYTWMKEITDSRKGNPIKINDSYSQAQLHILTNNKSSNNIVVEFKAVWPSILSGFAFATNTDDDVPPMVFDVNFEYDSFQVRRGSAGDQTVV